MHVFIEEEIAQLKIPMNNFLKMKIFEGIKDLEHEIPGLIFCKFSFSFDEIVQRLKLWNWYFICAQLKNDVHVKIIFKVMSEFYYVDMVELLMDIDFAHQLKL